MECGVLLSNFWTANSETIKIGVKITMVGVKKEGGGTTRTTNLNPTYSGKVLTSLIWEWLLLVIKAYGEIIWMD